MPSKGHFWRRHNIYRGRTIWKHQADGYSLARYCQTGSDLPPGAPLTSYDSEAAVHHAIDSEGGSEDGHE